ncbi:WW domain-binding protein 4 [Caerostris extrusa]|uniref:WW domain-binding protein 4 n=1 Tax=Caerostris extrusa TaxID=172846 RepID=A0AAV4S9B3_CAEEX|nr:WW domain-binding protein 4 [Caerostris extrusa]
MFLLKILIARSLGGEFSIRYNIRECDVWLSESGFVRILKSLPRKYCDICKCWFADNKASIEFHERGKRHQENAEKRINEIQKRGIKEFKKQKQLEDDMAKIERAALAAYRKDLENNLEVIPNENASKLASLSSFVEVPTNSNSTSKPKKQKEKKVTVKKEKAFEVSANEPTKETLNNVTVKQEIVTETRKWYEAMSEEGYKYYWNTETSVTQWEPPEEDFVSLEEQEKSNIQTANDNNTPEIKEEPKENIDNNNSYNKKSNKEMPVNSFGPQPKVDPYGQWVTVEHKEPEYVDLQLPKPSEDIVEVVIPVAKDEPKLRLKEKVIGQLTDTDPTEKVAFKKRKFASSASRNTRQRFTEDD